MKIGPIIRFKTVLFGLMVFYLFGPLNSVCITSSFEFGVHLYKFELELSYFGFQVGQHLVEKRIVNIFHEVNNRLENFLHGILGKSPSFLDQIHNLVEDLHDPVKDALEELSDSGPEGEQLLLFFGGHVLHLPNGVLLHAIYLVIAIFSHSFKFCSQSFLIPLTFLSWNKWNKTLSWRQVYNFFQDLWKRFPYFEGWGVGAKSLSVKAGQTDTDRH